ncbi:MAG: signal peptidase I [Woeseiaceae bacterium]|nr:signal peptidase I [Woeseiaceae bacterium]
MKSDSRKLGPIRAALSNLAGFGLGYVYVGRIELALFLIAGIVGVIAVAGWSGLVFQPVALYSLAVAALCVALFVMIHCGLIAARTRTAEARPYNAWWFYLLWVVGSWFVSEGIIWGRPVLFGFEPFNLPSASMAPTLQKGDLIMTDTWYYGETDPAYGDLVVFDVPGNAGTKYVKRVIGLPGDRVEIKDDVLVRNGQEIVEPYIQLTYQSAGLASNFGPVTVPKASYFMLGDNRHMTRDSRYIGPIDRSLLHGRVVHRWFAFDGSILWDRFPERLDNNGQ